MSKKEVKTVPLFRASALDNLIGVFSPKMKQNRMRIRASTTMMQMNGPHVSPYNGASSSRQAMKAWNTSYGSADRDLLPSLSKLRSRSRDAIRNIPIAAGAINKKTSNVVGTGLKCRPRINADLLGITTEKAREIERRLRTGFEIWAKTKECDAARTLNFYQLQNLALRSKLENGDSFALLPFIQRDGVPFDLRVNLIEGDRCMNPPFELPTKRLSGGIEVDKLNAPEAYWFADRHPQDIGWDSNVEYVRVPAFGETTNRPLVLHLFDQERIGQRRGAPWLSAVLEPIKQLGRYQDAEIMAAVVSGMYTVFIKTPSGTPTTGNIPVPNQVGNQPGQVTGDPGSYELGYGAVMDLAPGEDIESFSPNRPNTNYDPFVNSIFKEVGAALNMPYEVLLGSFNSSYSAARAAILQAWKQFKIDRADLSADFCQPTYEAFVMEAVDKGFVELPGFMDDPLKRIAWSACTWVGPAPGSIDPEKEGKAYKLFVDEQFMDEGTASQELLGQDYEETLEALAENKRLREEHGIAPRPGPAGTANVVSETVDELADAEQTKKETDEAAAQAETV